MESRMRSVSATRFFDRQKLSAVIALGFAVHFLMMGAVFEMYFSSPIDHGLTPVKSTDNPPAKRVVLIVADGLRADILYNNEELFPATAKMRKTRAAWGTSHTRVPTESRPGHVAILGGIYEDPSAIFYGWKANPVDFDSIINQSTNAYCFGSPDILRLFNNVKSDKVHFFSYDAEMEDFGKSNTSILDLWVFDEVKKFLGQNVYCEDCPDFYQQGNLFFLHLLGIDTAGHGFKPDSKEYMHNVKVVDTYVRITEGLFEYAFKDKSTAYVLTSDHGMTAWGSHGAGSDDETLTPIIVWGAGIKVNPEHVHINQVDIAPLLSTLVGINFPVNSIGKLPHHFLDVEHKVLATMVMNNAKQLAEIYKYKRDYIKNTTIYFVPFGDGSDDKDIDTIFAYFENQIEQEDPAFFTEINTFMNELLQGADYFQYYYRVPLVIAILIGFTFWIIYLTLIALSSNTDRGVNKFYLDFPFVCVFETVVTLIWYQSMPNMYYFYLTFPVVMSFVVLNKYRSILETLEVLSSLTPPTLSYGFWWLVIGIELLVLGFFYRFCFSLVLAHMTIAIWYSFKYSMDKKLKRGWLGMALLIAVFPLLEVMNTKFNIYLYVIGTAFYYSIMHLIINKFPFRQEYNQFMLKSLQFLCRLPPIIALAVEFNWIKPDSYLKYASWALSIAPFPFLFCTSTQLFARLTAIFMSFAPFYMLVTVNTEMLFLGVYVCLLYLWILIESRFSRMAAMHYLAFDEGLGGETNYVEEFRRGYFFMAFIFIGFFGTGNIASLNSFDPMWVRCFLTVFSPFKMLGLILLKCVVPFVFATCVFRAIHKIYRGSMVRRFCIVLLFSDLMLLHFLFNVTNEGSWLEIGMSLSHFVIMWAFIIIILIIYGISILLTSTEQKFYFFTGRYSRY